MTAADDADEERRLLQIEQMAADIENKRADTDYKRGLMRWEPWKIVIAAVAAGGVIGGAFVGGISYFSRQQQSPQPIIIQLPPPATR